MTELNEKKVYLHISNGGVTFSVGDSEYGPVIGISVTHFAHETNNMKIWVTKDGLRDLADLFVSACEQDYSPEYVCAAKSERGEEKHTHGIIRDSDQ